jgi:hypothetical protein
MALNDIWLSFSITVVTNWSSKPEGLQNLIHHHLFTLSYYQGPDMHENLSNALLLTHNFKLLYFVYT